MPLCNLSLYSLKLSVILTGPACGCFLVRISQSLSQRLCLSVWSDGKYFHIIVPVNRAGHFYLESPSSGFASLQELIFLYNETRKPFTSTCGVCVCALALCVCACVGHGKVTGVPVRWLWDLLCVQIG